MAESARESGAATSTEAAPGLLEEKYKKNRIKE